MLKGRERESVRREGEGEGGGGWLRVVKKNIRKERSPECIRVLLVVRFIFNSNLRATACPLLAKSLKANFYGFAVKRIQTDGTDSRE